MGSKYTVLEKCSIFAPSEGPKLLFQYQFLTIIDNIYKTVSRILFFWKVSNLDYCISSDKRQGYLINLGTIRCDAY